MDKGISGKANINCMALSFGYSRDNTIGFDSTNPKDGDLQLSAGDRYPAYDQLGPGDLE